MTFDLAIALLPGCLLGAMLLGAALRSDRGSKPTRERAPLAQCPICGAYYYDTLYDSCPSCYRALYTLGEDNCPFINREEETSWREARFAELDALELAELDR